MRKLLTNRYGSAWPIIIVIICICVASFLILILSYIVEPGLNLMGANDSDVNESVKAPRMATRSFMAMIWPYGLMLVILFGVIFAMFMYYQKRRYQQQ